MGKTGIIVSLLITTLASGAGVAGAGVPAAHFLPLQGYAVDDLGTPLATADLAVRVYDAATGGTLVHDSGADFVGAVTGGLVDVTIGATTALVLDNTTLYHLEIDLAGVEMIGDAAGGRYAFYPGSGDHSRPDLTVRLDALEVLAPPSKTGDPGQAPGRADLAFRGTGTTYQLEAGLLGTGLMRGSSATRSTVGAMQLQPVGIFAAGTRVLKLGPYHMPAPQQVSDVPPVVLPDRTRLRSCDPNPFNPQTTIHYDLAKPATVRIAIHDVAGRLVRRLRSGGIETAGRQRAVWRGLDDAGRLVASGVYLVEFRAGDVVQTRAITLLK